MNNYVTQSRNAARVWVDHNDWEPDREDRLYRVIRQDRDGSYVLIGEYCCREDAVEVAHRLRRLTFIRDRAN